MLKRVSGAARRAFDQFLSRMGIGIRAKLIIIFLVAKVIPLILLTVVAWNQFIVLGDVLRDIAVDDSSTALNDSAIENIERMTTDTAQRVADFLYARDDDLRLLASLPPTEENYRSFALSKTGRVVDPGEWVLAEDGMSWVPLETPVVEIPENVSTNTENNDMDGFHYRTPETFSYTEIPLYDEVTFVDLDGNEIVKVVTDSPKINYPMNPSKRNVSLRENTYIKAETYFDALKTMRPGDIYVSDVIGTYVGSNYIGMYTPKIVAEAAAQRGYDIPYEPLEQSYAGAENPNGTRFEGIVRFATPVADENGETIGYATFALNHDHLMELVDHQTPMNERYTELPSAYEGNYAFIWDYKCRSICHPRHNSIVGYDPETGEPQVPWLESSLYDAWQASGLEKWTDAAKDWPIFDHQSRSKTPAPILTQMGLVGLDGRYLNNAPQCTGWMDLTRDGGSGSFYILWSGLYKLTTAAAIPYYTGQYAPSEANDFSRRGFGIVTIGAGLEDFTRPARETEEKLTVAIEDNMTRTFTTLSITAAIIIVIVVMIAIWLASSITGNITDLIKGISRFRSGERQFRFHSQNKDEFGTLADSFDEMADSIVDSVKNPLTITDMNRRIVYMNDAGLDFCQMTLEEAVGTLYGDSSIYPQDSAYDPIKALEEGHESKIYYEPDSHRYLQGVANYFQNKDGEKIGFIVTSIDMTEVVDKQMKIEEQRKLLDEILTASPDLIWYQDAQGRYLSVNPRFSSLAGKAPDDFVGKTAEEMLPASVAEGFYVNDMQAIASHAPVYSEEHVTFADGHSEVLDSVRTPIFTSDGTPVGVLGFARNVTTRVTIENELRRTQLELEQAVSDANRANEHKGEFLARMSHEIRTPMNAIIGLTNIVERRLEDKEVSYEQIEEVKGHIRQIEVSSQHLLGLLNDILDISKIEAGKIELIDEVMEMPKLVQTVAGIIKPRCDEKNITFDTQFEQFEPSTFKGDNLRLRQVLINLLGNAVKFTPELGTITFEMSRLDRREGKSLIHFSIRDNGIGISKEAQATIFDSFEQGDRKITRQFGGTGLGLAISQRIVQMFGGEIVVHSALGKGSEFTFDIWLTETEADLPEEKSADDFTDRFRGKRALLVDDVEINRMIVMAMLEMTGLTIDEAEDGDVAVEKFAASAPGTYDIIFMDVQMPRMDGYEASDTIRAMDHPDAKTVPIVTLTANAFQDDIDKAMQHGMNAHVTKPVEMDKLLEVLFRFLDEA